MGFKDDINHKNLDVSIAIDDSVDDKNVIVAFGGISLGIGMPPFEFYKQTTDFETKNIYFKDLHQAWYHKGIKNTTVDVKTTAEYLKKTIDELGVDNIVFVGNSMGAYAAILFGTLLNVDKVVAFSPQSFIDEANRKQHRDSRWHDKISRAHKYQGSNTEYFDLVPYLKIASFDTKISVYYGVLEKLDKLHAERLKGYVELNPYPDLDHTVARVLRDRGELKEILMNSVI